MAHYIRRNLPQTCCGLRITGYLVRNAKLIHEQKGPSRSTRGVPRDRARRRAPRMNESTNQRVARRSTFQRGVLNQFIWAKAGTSPASFDEQLPYQPAMAV